jgi:hypothetical protein
MPSSLDLIRQLRERVPNSAKVVVGALSQRPLALSRISRSRHERARSSAIIGL